MSIVEALVPLEAIAREAAELAGRYIASRRPQAVEHKSGGGASLASQIVTEVDRESESIIVERLTPTRARFELGMLSEESVDDGSRLRAPAFWCIDPLDGTLCYVEGAPGCAVSIALVAQDGTPLIGVVYDITRGLTLRAIRGAGVRLCDAPWGRPQRSPLLRVFGDRSHTHEPRYVELVDRLRVAGPVSVEFGRAATTNAWAALEHPDGVYTKVPKAERGGGCSWDFAAAACIVTEAGGVATSFDGTPLPLNNPDTTFMNASGVMFASSAGVAERVRAAAS